MLSYEAWTTDEQRYAIISPYFDERIKMNGPYPEITNISFLAKLFFKAFVGLSDCRNIGLSDYSYGPGITSILPESSSTCNTGTDTGKY